MLRHLVRLVWNRKRANSLVILEIFATFLVLAAVLTAAFQAWNSYGGPLGFSIQDVWSVGISRHDMSLTWDARFLEESKAEDQATFGRLVTELEGLDAVQAVAAVSVRPYSVNTMSTVWRFEGRDIESEFGWGSDRLAEVMGLEVVAGRWFEPADSALGWEPVVINPQLARTLFGPADPLGRRIEDAAEKRDRRVVGVVKAFRHHGEFSNAGPFLFERVSGDGNSDQVPEFLVLRMAPGISAAFEETLARRLEAIAPRWTFSVSRLETARSAYFRGVLAPALLVGAVAGFLLIMVLLGLSGVMWQNVVRRTRELGLRRALGAGAGDIQRQIVTEVMILAALGAGAGAAVVLQVPLIGPWPNLAPKTVFAGVACAGVLMLVFAAACGLYPGWLATRVRPADALHFE